MSMPSTARASLALAFGLSVLGAACDAPAKKQATAPGSAAPAVPSVPGSATPSCDSDDDCTRPWTPSMEGCASLDRCFDGACIAPPAVTGLANGGTGRVAFETSAGEKSWQVEVARSPFETQRGLMCRTSMKSDWGMLFLLDSTRLQAFWMKNTLIPLDMVFITEDWTVAGVVTEAPPRTLEPRGVNTPSRYVLELATGEARRAGLTTGTKVRFYAPRGE
jgi:uncharacterized membrane protein (UPF0127 family)